MRKEAASELARGREGGRVARRCLSSISTRYVRERERESTKHAFHANYNAFPWRTNRLFCRHLSNNPPQFIWIGTLKGSAVPGDLSSQEDVALSQVAQNWSITSFNLFISCHSTFFDKKKNFQWIHRFLFLVFWNRRQYRLKTLAREMLNFNDNRDRAAQRHFDTSQFLFLFNFTERSKRVAQT